ncbi:hypothetical protein DNL40_01900 [Xylanimonas oleitrophica]|uniref:Uncharacterized protein n=1 Tax=Xylanimonas oleitrophica TaxID=2607479 RepID=A0A2W5WV39_9MICO|nr:DUF2017 family protein [Xylanimonas oleitrophica]PZR55157.1 hypothetical protein DNL40_01900 [Xylanimonas oleitrophica]
MTPFRATPAGYEAFWEDAERQVIAGVAREVAVMLRDQAGLPERDEEDPLGALEATTQSTGTPREPDDPAARRLLPDASRRDDDVSAEFRHLTQTDIAAGKVRALERFADLVDGGDGRDGAGGGYGDADDEADLGLDDLEALGGADTVADLVDDLDGPEDGGTARPGIVVIGHDAARDAAAALTDVRLVVAQRLGLDTDDDVELLHDEVLADVVSDDPVRGLDADVRRYWGGIFVATGFAQQSLVEAMLDDLRGRRRPA